MEQSKIQAGIGYYNIKRNGYEKEKNDGYHNSIEPQQARQCSQAGPLHATPLNNFSANMWHEERN